MQSATPFQLRYGRTVDAHLWNWDWAASGVGFNVGIGPPLNRIVQKLIGHFAYVTRNRKIPSMILLAVSQMENSVTSTSDVPRPNRIMAIDFGARKIGLAVTDELGLTAQGLATYYRSNKKTDFDHFRRVIKQYGVTEIVMGLPLRMSGVEGIQAEKVQAFAEELRHRFKLPVQLFDERLTSVEANRLLRETEMSTRRRGEVVDQLAAVLILQAFLEFRKSSQRE